MNGHFELRQDRTGLNTDKGLRSDWNLALLEVSAVPTMVLTPPSTACLVTSMHAVWGELL